MRVAVGSGLLEVFVQSSLVGGSPGGRAAGVESEHLWTPANRLNGDIADTVCPILLTPHARSVRRVRPALGPEDIGERLRCRCWVDIPGKTEPLQPAILEEQCVPAAGPESLPVAEEPPLLGHGLPERAFAGLVVEALRILVVIGVFEPGALPAPVQFLTPVPAHSGLDGLVVA